MFNKFTLIHPNLNSGYRLAPWPERDAYVSGTLDSTAS